jgi:amidase
VGTEDATGAAARVRAGACTPRELVTAALARIDAGNGALNAVIHRRDDQALAEADGALGPGPFRGVPILVKDHGCGIAGEPTTNGMRVLRDVDHRAPADASLTRRLRAAGFVIVGRTNVPEMCTAGTTEPIAFGPTRNPWDHTRSTGGSRGGSAAAVAAGFVAVAHGSDGGDSVRMPAACCGIVGLKPSRGRISAAPDGAPWAGLSTDGVLARTVRDAAAVLDVMSGAEPGDPYHAPPLPGPLAEEAGREPGSLRIGLRLHGAGDADPTHPEVAAVLTALAAQLEALGHQVEPAWPAALDDPDAAAPQGRLVAADVAAEVARIEAALGRPIALDELEPWNARLVEAGNASTGAQIAADRERLTAWSRALVAWWRPFGAFDLLLTPVITQPVFALGWMRADRSPEEMAGIRRHLGWLLGAWNVTGQPAISVPAGLAAGLPVGAQLVAAPGREDVLVRVAAQIERAAPWPLTAPVG